jgi:polar amino acid transport system permease protein
MTSLPTTRDLTTKERGGVKRALGTGARWLAKIVIVAAVVLIVRQFVTSPAVDWGVVAKYLFSTRILSAVLTTVYLTVIAMACGVVLGTALELMRQSQSRLLAVSASFYIWFFRGTPLLVQIIFWFNLALFVPRVSLSLPGGSELFSISTNTLVTPLVAAILALGLNEGAYMAEIVRGGILGIDKRQLEAALALGMTKRQADWRIVLRQAIRGIIPPTGNQTIGMLKTTSLVSVISLSELLYSVQSIYNENFKTISLLIVASIWYLVIGTVLSVVQYTVERRLSRADASPPPPSFPARITEYARRIFLGERDSVARDGLGNDAGGR